MKRLIIVLLIVSLLPAAVYAADNSPGIEEMKERMEPIFYRNEEGELMIQILQLDEILIRPFQYTTIYADKALMKLERLFAPKGNKPILVHKNVQAWVRENYPKGRLIRIYSEGSDIIWAVVGTAGITYVYITMTPNKVRRAGAFGKVLGQLKKLF